LIGKSTKRWELGARRGSVDTALVGSAVIDMVLVGAVVEGGEGGEGGGGAAHR